MERGGATCLDSDADNRDVLVVNQSEEKSGSLLGKIVHSEEEAYKLSCEYASSIGFRIRCSKNRYYEKTSLISKKEYVCQNEGVKRVWKPGDDKKRKLTTRCGCPAIIRFSVSRDGTIWKVTHHVEEHNHDLGTPGERRLKRRSKQWVPHLEVESGLMRSGSLLGEVVHSEEEAYKLSCEYASSIGFRIRCSKNRYYEKTSLIRQKEYVCQNEGVKRVWKPSDDINRKLTTRCGCPAIIRFSVSRDGTTWKVTHHIEEHNHDLGMPGESHLKGCSEQGVCHHVEEHNYDLGMPEERHLERCSEQEVPHLEVESGLMRHAAKVYADEIFKMFKKEYLEVLALTWREITSVGSLYYYEVKGEELDSRAHVVIFDKSNVDVSCTCKLFEVQGILCRHALKILVHHNFTKLPVKYILTRCTNQPNNVVSCDHLDGNANEPEIAFLNSRYRNSYNLITQCVADERSRRAYDIAFEEFVRKMGSVLNSVHLDGDVGENRQDFVVVDEIVEEHLNQTPIPNPPRVSTNNAPNIHSKSPLEKHKPRTKKTKANGECLLQTPSLLQGCPTFMGPMTTHTLFHSTATPIQSYIPPRCTLSHAEVVPPYQGSIPTMSTPRLQHS